MTHLTKDPHLEYTKNQPINQQTKLNTKKGYSSMNVQIKYIPNDEKQITNKHMKKFNILNHQENANFNLNSISQPKG